MRNLSTAPAWIREAFAEAKKLRLEANAFWREHLGDTGLFGGFQVRPIGTKGAVEFEIMLWGGDCAVAGAAAIRRLARAHVLGKANRRRKVAA